MHLTALPRAGFHAVLSSSEISTPSPELILSPSEISTPAPESFNSAVQTPSPTLQTSLSFAALGTEAGWFVCVLKMYPFIPETERERESTCKQGDGQGERTSQADFTLSAEPHTGPIPGPRDHNLS